MDVLTLPPNLQRNHRYSRISRWLIVKPGLLLVLISLGVGGFTVVQPSSAAAFQNLSSNAPASSCRTRLQSMVDAAAPVSIVSVPACLYRETVTINKPLTLAAQPGAEIRGSDVWTGWKHSGTHWTHSGVPAFRPHGSCRLGTLRCRWAEQVFFDGRPLLQVALDPVSGQFSVAEGVVTLADDPANHKVEVSTRTHWIVGAAPDVTIQGFVMKHAGNAAQDGAINNNGFSRWTIQNNTLSDSHGPVVKFSAGGGHKLLSNDISRSGVVGVHGSHAGNVLVRGNRLHNNNTEQFNPNWEAGGLKMIAVTRLTVDRNEVYDNDGPGLWCDLDCNFTTYSNNRVHHNAKYGISYEMSHNGKAFGNVAWENGWGYPNWGFGAGILCQSCNHMDIFDNTVAWNADGISVISADRGVTHNVLDVNVHGNRIISTGNGPKALGWYERWAGPLYDPVSNNRGSLNRYWYPAREGTYARFKWSAPGFALLSKFNATPGEQGGRYLTATEQQQVLAAAGVPAVADKR